MGKDGGEVELPVEEALLGSDLLADAEPRVLREDEVDGHGAGESEVERLVVAELVPAGAGGEGLVAPSVLRLSLMSSEEHLEGVDPLGEGGRLDAFLREGPEPQGAPGVHDPAQPLVGATLVGECLLDLLALHCAAGPHGVGSPDGDAAPDLGLGDAQALQGDLPERLDPAREVDEDVDLALAGLGVDRGAPGLQGGECLRRELLGLLRVDRRPPPGGGQHEVVDAAGNIAGEGAGSDVLLEGREGDVPRDVLEVLLAAHLLAAEHGPSGPDEGVAAAQVEPEPGCVEPLDHRVEPQRDLGELDRGGVEVDPVDVVEGEVGLRLLQAPGVVVGVDALAELALPAVEVLLGELAHRLDRERARAERGLAHRHREDVAGRGGGAALVEELGEGLADGEPGEDLGGVVGGRLLALAAGEPEHERAGLVDDRLRLAGEPVLGHDEVVAADAVGAVGGHDPRALARVAGLGDLVQVGLGEEAGIGHEPLVDGAELVDAELGVGDEPAVAAAGLLAQQQVGEDLLQGRVAELHVVDMGGRGGVEEVGAQRVEGQALGEGGVGLGPVALVDEAEQHAERLVQVGAGACLRGGELDLHELAEPVEAVALGVLGRADRQHPELGGRLGVQEEQDPVEEPQGLLGEGLGLLGRQRRQVLLAPS